MLELTSQLLLILIFCSLVILYIALYLHRHTSLGDRRPDGQPV